MSLTLPAVYSASSKQSNIVENWIFQLGFNNGDLQGKGEGGWSAVLQSDGTPNLLTADVSDSTATIGVDDGAVFQVGDFLTITSDGGIETIKIIDFHPTNHNILYVVRAQMGTTAIPLDDNDPIYWNNFTPLSLSDTTVDDVFYHGAVTNTPSIRDAIDLAKSTASSNNISLNVVNFEYKGYDFSKMLVGGTNNYINQEVRVYSQLSGVTDLSNCLQIYSGRLMSVSHDHDLVKLSIVSKRPWDFISVPNKLSTNGNYFPVAYGDYAHETSTEASVARVEDAVCYPINPDRVNGEDIVCLMPFGSGFASTDAQFTTEAVPAYGRLHFYESGLGRFSPLDPNNDTVTTLYGGTTIHSSASIKRAFRVHHDAVTEAFDDFYLDETDPDPDEVGVDDPRWLNYADISSTSGLSDNNAMYVSNRSNGDEIVVLSTGETATTTKIINVGRPDGYCSKILFKIKYAMQNDYSPPSNADEDVQSSLQFSIDGGASYRFVPTDGSGGGQASISGNAEITDHTENDIVIWDDADPDNALYNKDFGQFRLKHAATNPYDTDTQQFACWVNSIKFTYVAQVGFGERASIESMKGKLFSGADCTPKSWDTGNMALELHEMHRDILYRFLGYTDTPYNWSSNLNIESVKDWAGRYWITKPTDLKKVLDKLAFEGGFIGKYRADGTFSYWFVKDSYAPSDIVHTIKKEDISKISIKNTSFGKLQTKMNINYEKHPAEDKYATNTTASNSSSRTRWDIKTRENIKEINLDAYVSPAIPTTPGSPNDDFYSYYDNIFGDIKLVVSGTLVNPKYYNLEAGDVVKFSDIGVDPFGYSWGFRAFMITDVTRSLGSIKFSAREVGDDDYYSILLDGDLDYLLVLDHNDLSFSGGDDSPFSISAWVKPGADVTGAAFISKGIPLTGGEYRFYFDNSDKLSLEIGQAVGVLTSKKTEDAYTTHQSGGADAGWHHYACTYDGGGGANAEEGIKIYVDGVSQVVEDGLKLGTFANMTNTSNAVRLGQDGFTNYADWHVSDTGIWSKELSESDISYIYNNGKPTDLADTSFSTDLVAWWRMGDGTEEASGTTVYDMSENSHNATMINTVTDDSNYIADAP